MIQRLAFDDTIAAIATALGEGGIGIVKISGPKTLEIVEKIFFPKNKTPLSGFKNYALHYGWVKDREGNIVDEALLSIMRKPNSYTKEDVAEINSHGGIVALRRILDLVLENGCRLAEPGEFTKRAFLNGRIDLSQAEAVLDIICSKTDAALKLSAQQLKGGLSLQINKIRQELISALSVLEAGIDFPEDEPGAMDFKNIKSKLYLIKEELNQLLEGSYAGRIWREGINAVICGRPNVGKSSLLNAILKQERSIVTPIAGTTRDTVEEIIDIKGIPVRIVDTAGIIEPRDLIEKKAVARSKKYMASADLIILVFDGSQKLSSEDRSLIKKLRNRVILTVINKSDLKQKIEKEEILKNFPHLIQICAKKNKNISLLEEAVVNLVYKGHLVKQESVLVSNLRHIQALKKAKNLIAEGCVSMDNKLSSEFIAQDIKDALGYLDDILGKRFSEELLDKIFADFCIGK